MDIPAGGARTIFAGGGRIYGYSTVNNAPQQVCGADPQRFSITFHNPGANDIFVAPTTIQNTGSDVPLIPSPTALMGCLRVYGNGGTLVISGTSAQKAWQAFSADNGNNPFTVMDSKI